MRGHSVVGLLGIGIGVGVAFALSGTAAADAIDDAWPYTGNGPYYIAPALPGFLEAGSGTNGGQNNFGPITDTYGDYVATHTSGGTDEWYSAHDNNFVIPSFYTDDHQGVTALLDGSATFPTVGTVFDQSVLFPIYNPAFGTINLFENSYVNDPQLGFADQFTMNFLFSAASNTFLSDAAGVKDVVGFDGQYFTLFDLPLSTASGAETSDAGDGFAQLLAELTASGS